MYLYLTVFSFKVPGLSLLYGENLNPRIGFDVNDNLAHVGWYRENPLPGLTGPVNGAAAEEYIGLRMNASGIPGSSFYQRVEVSPGANVAQRAFRSIAFNANSDPDASREFMVFTHFGAGGNYSIHRKSVAFGASTYRTAAEEETLPTGAVSSPAELALYPNPSLAFPHIVLPGATADELVSAQIMTSSGMRLLHFEGIASDLPAQAGRVWSTLASGAYLVRVAVPGSGMEKMFRVVKP